ncbi:hypothetical protein ACFL2B_00390 [Patescibacteria group bacterium]
MNTWVEHTDNSQDNVMGDIMMLTMFIMILVAVVAFTVLKPIQKNTTEVESDQLEQVLNEMNQMEGHILAQQNESLENMQDQDSMQRNNLDAIRIRREKAMAKGEGRFTKLAIYLRVRNGKAYISLNNRRTSLKNLIQSIKDLRAKRHYVVVYAKADAAFPVGDVEMIKDRVRRTLRSYYGDWDLEIAKRVRW